MTEQPAPCTLSVWVLLLVLSSSYVAHAVRPYADHGEPHHKAASMRKLTQEVAGSLNRQLRQVALCPDGCVDGYCAQDSTSGGLRCQKCEGNLIVSRVDGTCVCPPGKYSTGGPTCVDCPKGSWCEGGRYSISNPPNRNNCTSGLTTLGLRSTSARGCVNLPGYSYSVTTAGVPSATLCPVDTYGPGLKKQRACVPCPTGFTTNGQTGLRSPTACVVPAGYYLKAPGQAAPCPKGEWKSGTGSNGNCTKCAYGVTTEFEASVSEDNCTLVIPGHYARQMRGAIITAVAVCPQKYYCPGGRPIGPFDPLKPTWLATNDPTIKLCPNGTWTQAVSSTALQQCLTPPGFKTSGGVTVPCGDNEFRADWKPAEEATTCSSCGKGVYASKTDQIMVYDIENATEKAFAVTTTADDCYILPGMGLMYNTLERSWRAVQCNGTNYGVSNITYGLTPAPCTACPMNMVTSRDTLLYPNSSMWYHSNTDGTGGFISPLACVNQAGYGYNGRISQKCDKGYYNMGDTYTTCTACGFGLTTSGPGAGTRETSCGIAPGHGWGMTQYFNMSTIQCPVGYYNDAIQLNRTTPCTQCSNGTTTSKEGAESADDCDMCLPGWGGENCATQCGGYGSAASYGPAGRERGSACIPCNDALSYYSYNWQNQNDVWGAPVAARLGADSAADCLAQYAQIVDGAWYLPLTGLTGVTTTQNITSFADCVALCKDQCQFVTYDYRERACTVRNVEQVIYDGAPYIAFKGFTAGTTAASSVKTAENGTASAKEKHYGQYTIWWDPNANQVGRQVDAPNAGTFERMQNCMEACDYDRRCAGITVQMTIHPGSPVNNVGPKTCKLIYGDTRPGVFQRTVVRMDPSKVEIPTYMKVCRYDPPPVFRGNWPISCRGTPIGGQCVAFCDCSPDECYARDGCPTTICQPDGTWGPFTPEKCALAIPAQPQAISCPTPIRPGLYNSRRRQLLGKGKGEPLYYEPPTPAILAAAREKTQRIQAQHEAAEQASRRLLQLMYEDPSAEASPWDPWDRFVEAEVFTAMWSDVGLRCPEAPANLSDYNGGNFTVLNDPQFGYNVAENWLCNGAPTGQVIGIAAQDFMKGDLRNKYEATWKYNYESYVWSYFTVPSLPDNEQPFTTIQGFQLMIVGNVGTDHPCQAVCSVTAIDFAIFDAYPGETAPEPGSILAKRYIKLQQNQTFSWSTNETAVLNFDVDANSAPLLLGTNKAYWVRLKVVAPFNGTDGSGNARCYAYIGLRDQPKYFSVPPRWTEAGGYNTTCKGLRDGLSTPPFDQTISNCTNGGAPGSTTNEACSAVVQTNTCSPTKYGADVPRSCPFAGQDIVYSMYGFVSNQEPSNPGVGGAPTPSP